MRENRPAHHELDVGERTKSNTRSYTNQLVKRGQLEKPAACGRCGEPKPQAHHPDYGDPRTVEWLCRHCHLILHQAERERRRRELERFAQRWLQRLGTPATP